MSQITLQQIQNGDTEDATPVMSNLNALANRLNLGVETDNIADGAVTGVKLAVISTPGKISGAALTSLNLIPSGAGVIPLVNIPSSVPINYRSAMYVMQASPTTITVAPGVIEVGGISILKTVNTTLDITAPGDWAGGASLQNTSTKGYVIIDSSGNLKLTTSAPSHADFAVSITAANNTLRYATVSTVVYRYIGWFYMNATGSGQLDAFGVSNLADGTVKNVVEFETGANASGSTTIPGDNTAPQNNEGDQYMSQVFVPTNQNSKIKISVVAFFTHSLGYALVGALFQDSILSALASYIHTSPPNNNVDVICMNFNHYMKSATTSLVTFKFRAGNYTAGGGTLYFNGTNTGGLMGGTLASSIRIEEIEAQLT